MSASGLPGNRLEAMRAGIRMSASGVALGMRALAKTKGGPGAYTGCQRSGKPVSVRRCQSTVAPRTDCPAPGARFSMNSFELNKILGAVLGTCLILLALNIGAGALFYSPAPAKPGFMIAVAKTETGKPEAKEPEVPLPVLLAKAN